MTTAHVIEQFVASKDAHRPSEDVIVAGTNYIAVIDGATTPAFVSADGVTSGRCAALAVAQCLRALVPDATLGEFIAAAAEEISRSARHEGIPLELPTASAAVVSLSRDEVWLIGDVRCSLAARAPLAQHERAAIDRRIQVIRSALNSGASVDGLRRHDIGRAAITDILDEAIQWRNDPFSPHGYAALAAFPPPPSMCRVIPLPRAAIQIVLTSDGYPEALDTLSATEEALRADLREDPLRIGRHPATKAVAPGADSFDDRAYLRVRIR